MTEYVTEFVRESEENITELNNALLELEDDPDDEEAIDRIFRTAHTLKGNCGAMGLDEASHLAHAIEDLLTEVRAGRCAVNSAFMDDVFEAVDVLEEMIADVERQGEIETDPASTIERIRDRIDERTVELPSDEEIDEVLARLDPPVDEEHETYFVRLSIDEHDRAADVTNGTLVVEALIDAFDLLGTDPTRERIDENDYGDRFDAVFGSAVGEAAIASALEPVDAVEAFEIVVVTDRLSRSDDTESIPDVDSADVSAEEAQDLGVDELLDEFAEFDDLDSLVDDIDDAELEPFEEMGDAGSFDDLLGGSVDDTGAGVDAVDPPTSPAEAEVDDAGTVFEELKREVEMVDFDELQDELAELEFDEYEDEVEMEDLIGDDVAVDDATFLDDEPHLESGPDLEAPSEDEPTVDDLVADDTPEGGETPEEAFSASDSADDAVGTDAVDAAFDAGFDSFGGAEDDVGDAPLEDPADDAEADLRETADDAENERAQDAAETDSDGESEPEDEPEVDPSDVAAETDEFAAGTDGEVANLDADEGSAETDNEGADGTSADVEDDGADEAAEPTNEDDSLVADPEESPFEFGTEIEDGGPTEAEPADAPDAGFGSDAATEADGFTDDGEVEFADAEDQLTADADADEFADADADGLAAELDPDDAAVEFDAEEAFDGELGFDETDDSFEDEFGADVFDSPADDSYDAVDADAAFDVDETDGSRSDFGSDADRDADRVVDEPEIGIPDLTVPERADRSGVGSDDERMGSVRVDVEQIDELGTLVEGLVTSRVRLRDAIESGTDRAVIDRELDDLEDLTTDLQETVMDVRLVPLERVTNRLPRVVRDIARDQGKTVSFELTGGDVELDRSVLDRIRDPLIHLVRNAVDHGIEMPEEREAAEKPREGTVAVTAERSRDRVTITVEDDGGGIDPDRLRETAVESGVLEENSDLEEAEALELIFHPGLSTSEEVTDVSGRGVGMDVVERTVEELDGSVSIDSEREGGTTVTMTLPVSVAIADVLFVESGGEEFGVPLKAVRDIDSSASVELIDGEEYVVSTANDAQPVVSLADAFATSTRSENGDGMVVRVRDEIRPVAIRCDRVRDQQEVVVNPFEGFMADIPGVSGATVRGRGEVVPILDVTTL